MYAVGRLGSYISRGVYIVSGPFHPFGGAVDIIVVEQQDGSFKSSPWYVRFGKFQGVLKAKEKVVSISVDGVPADFHMYLDSKGEAYFLREVDVEGGGDSVLSPSSSGDETDEQSGGFDKRPVKSKSCNFDTDGSSLVTQIDISNGKILKRTSSRRSRIMGLVFGRKSMIEDTCREEEDISYVVRSDSLERAEIAAELLEVNWSTNFASSRYKKAITSHNSPPERLEFEEDKAVDSLLNNGRVNILNSPQSDEEISIHGNGMANNPQDGLPKLEISDDSLKMLCLSTNNIIGTSSLGGSLQENYELNLQKVKEVYEFRVSDSGHDKNSKSFICEIPTPKSVQDTSLLVAKEPLEFPKILVDENSVTLLSDAQIRGSDGPCSNSPGNSSAAEMYAQRVNVEEINSVKDVESCSICTLSGLDNSISEVQDGKKPRENPVADLQEFRSDSLSIGPITLSPFEEFEEELIFGDIDDFNQGEIKCMESSPSNQLDNEYRPPVNSKYREAVIESVIQSLNPNDLIQENTLNTVEDFKEKTLVVSRCISIPSDKDTSKKFRWMAESLPNMWSHTHGVVVDDLHHPLGHSLDANSEPLMLTPLREDFSRLVMSDVNKEEEQATGEDAQLLEELKNGPANTAVGNQPQGIDAASGSWRVWPFRFKNSSSMKATHPVIYPTRSSDDKITLEGSSGMDGETDVLKTKVKRKKVRVLTPTTEQLASLNLKEGKNIVTFTFSTSMLGQQQVDARIYLWKWDTRVVISDVDGTITKSDVLGQFMPLVGMDWSHTGVAHLFSAIKENGYHLLFLSARAISQAYHTRRFLFNLKQDGKALPDGPVVISPDGLFPSLYREVIRRAPHEFKIACLEDIKALFPSDRNPFYAGFGNRETDEFSYLKVGIPKGKIFIINPKGEVVVNRRVDSKSYTSLHALVHDMFPPMSSSEQEYFNSWNYWKLPPAIDF